MGRSRTPANAERLRSLRIFIGIAAVLWLVGAIAAVIDGDTLQAVSWFCLAAFGGLCAGGFVHGRQEVAYLAIGLLVVAVVISMGVFIAD